MAVWKEMGRGENPFDPVGMLHYELRIGFSVDIPFKSERYLRRLIPIASRQSCLKKM
jgi:hypothetical protein